MGALFPLRQFSNRLAGMGLCYPRGAKIDWTHPLTNGLVAYYLVSDQLADKVTGTSLIFNPPTNGFVTPDMSVYGPSWAFPGVAQTSGLDGGFHSPYHPLTSSGALNLTIAGLAMQAGGLKTGGNGSPFYSERAPSGNDIIKISYSGGSAGTYIFTIRDDAGTLLNATINAAGTLSDFIYHHIVATKVGNGTNNVNAYIDGALTGTSPFSYNGSTSFTDANATIVGAADNQDNSGTFPGSIVYSAAWTRALSSDEVLSLYLDPWQFLIPPDTSMQRAAMPFLPPGMPIYASNIQYLNRTIGY